MTAALARLSSITIMLIATIAVGGVKTSYAYLAERAKRFFENTGAKRKLDIAAGVLLLGTGLFVFFRN